MQPLNSLGLKLFLTCLLALVLSHVVLAVVFAVLFEHSLASLHLTAAALSQMKQLFSVASFLSLALTSIVLFLLSRRITAPLRDMQRVALQIARGDFEHRVSIKTHDEVGALAKTFNAMAAELAGLDQMRKDFVANVSHDLRSPLTSMHGFVQAFLDEAVPPERQRQYLLLMHAQTERMIKLVNDLLDLARLEAGQLDIRPASFNLSELVRQVVARLGPEWGEKQVTVEVSAPEAPDLFVWADPDRIDQVLVNLVQNAIHFSPPEGDVEVRVTQAAQAVVSVRDAGPGIRPEDLDAIWQRFYKADPARTTPAGTGIGLSIVKHILDLHQSPISVHSEVGKGATFTFTLPLAPHQ
ncbi:MAG TPA: HAMP domain-containing sensor histidine kinase [Ktedonobacterales bacterium]|nr:HAMP domain-containing sensor histidine kinase [Ktedonobacterales bacterium]